MGNKTQKHSMLKTKDLFFEQYLEDISPDAILIDWKKTCFLLLDALREDFDYIEDSELNSESRQGVKA